MAVLAHMTAQQPPCLSPLTFLTCSATRAASVKASLTPRFFIAEHSAACCQCTRSAHRQLLVCAC